MEYVLMGSNQLHGKDFRLRFADRIDSTDKITLEIQSKRKTGTTEWEVVGEPMILLKDDLKRLAKSI